MTFKFGTYFFQDSNGFTVTLQYNKWIAANLDATQDTIISVNYNITIITSDAYPNGSTHNREMLFTILLTYRKWVNEEEAKILSKQEVLDRG